MIIEYTKRPNIDCFTTIQHLAIQDKLVDNLVIMGGGSFPHILDLFLGLKMGVPTSSGCLRETSIFKIIMIDDVMLWSKLESTVHGKSAGFINSVSQTDDIQDVSAEQSTEKWTS